MSKDLIGVLAFLIFIGAFLGFLLNADKLENEACLKKSCPIGLYPHRQHEPEACLCVVEAK